MPPDLLLGLAHAERRKEHTITLSEDEALLLYTDGLLEQPRPSDRRLRWSEDDLLAWLRERPTVADIDLDALLWDFGRDAFEDDVAVMLLAFAPRG